LGRARQGQRQKEKMIEIERDFEILPVLEFRGLISKALTENKVFICISETGSGYN
jgi:HrpA-like RNA helicase